MLRALFLTAVILATSCHRPPPVPAVEPVAEPAPEPHDEVAAEVEDAPASPAMTAHPAAERAVEVHSTAQVVADSKPIGGRLCIKGPGIYDMVGKGASARQEMDKWRAAARRVNAGMVLTIGDREVTVRGTQGGSIEGLALDKRHAAKVRTVDGSDGGGFRFRFDEGEDSICAYYNGFYDNWRLRPVGKKGCGPCEGN
jgi:hypothetical protein